MTVTTAEWWQQRFAVAKDREWVRMDLNHRFTPFATLFDKTPRTTGGALDKSIIKAEFYMFEDGSILDSFGERAIEVISPTLWERTPENGRLTIQRLGVRNIGTTRRPLFAEDILVPKDRALLEASHFWQQQPIVVAAGR